MSSCVASRFCGKDTWLLGYLGSGSFQSFNPGLGLTLGFCGFKAAATFGLRLGLGPRVWAWALL